MDYVKITKTSEKWGIMPKQIQVLCAEGCIESAVWFGNRFWAIHAHANKPADARIKRGASLC